MKKTNMFVGLFTIVSGASGWLNEEDLRFVSHFMGSLP